MFFVLCYLLFAPCLFAIDMGLVLDQNAAFSSADEGAAFAYKGIAIPRLSGLIGDMGEFYVSAGLNFYSGAQAAVVPELLRTNFNWRSGGLELAAGRMDYSDPLGYIASGLFDGGRASLGTGAGTFSAGAWYTGLLYKKRANIEMTGKEAAANSAFIDYNDFSNTYFAPRRVLAAIDWEHKGFMDRAIARLSLLGQFDMGEEKVHSQYLAGKAVVPFRFFSFALGGCFEVIEANEKAGSAFAAEASVAWRNPAHRVSLEAKFASGESDTAPAFLPVTANAMGQVLRPKPSGISAISVDYAGRLLKTLSIGVTPMYFISTDSQGADGKRLLGGEIFSALYWNPVPDISINFGGGAFLPSLGDVAPNGKNIWRAELNVILSLF